MSDDGIQDHRTDTSTDVDAGERLVAVSRVSNRWVVGGLAALAAVRLIRGRDLAEALMILVAAFGLGTVRVVANREGLAVGFGPWGWPARRIPRARIQHVRIEEVSPMQWGGWGYRIRGSASRVVVCGGPAVVVELTGGWSFGVTVPDAESFARVLSAPTPALVGPAPSDRPLP